MLVWPRNGLSRTMTRPTASPIAAMWIRFTWAPKRFDASRPARNEVAATKASRIIQKMPGMLLVEFGQARLAQGFDPLGVVREVAARRVRRVEASLQAAEVSPEPIEVGLGERRQRARRGRQPPPFVVGDIARVAFERRLGRAGRRSQSVEFASEAIDRAAFLSNAGLGPREAREPVGDH